MMQMNEMNTKIYASQDWVEEKIASIGSTGGGKEPFIVTVEYKNDHYSFSASFNTMWAAYEEGRQVLISYMGRDYIQPIFFADGVFDDGKGKRILVEWDDKKYANSGNLEDADEIKRHVHWFYSDEADTRELRTNFSIPHSVTHFTGNSRNQVMSQYGVTYEINKLTQNLKNNKSPNPEPIIIDGEEYDGSVKTEINTVRNWNELEDRPFGEGVVETLTYRGTLIGVTSISLGEGKYLVKLSDKPLTDPSAIKSYTVSTPSDSTKITDFTIEGDDKVWAAFTEGSFGNVFNIIEADGEYASAGLTPGLWVSLVDSDGIKMYVSEVVFKTEGIKTIDEKFLPETAKGQDGLTPHIGDNGNWWIGDTDTGVAAGGSGGGLSYFEKIATIQLVTDVLSYEIDISAYKEIMCIVKTASDYAGGVLWIGNKGVANFAAFKSAGHGAHITIIDDECAWVVCPRGNDVLAQTHNIISSNGTGTMMFKCSSVTTAGSIDVYAR